MNNGHDRTSRKAEHIRPPDISKAIDLLKELDSRVAGNRYSHWAAAAELLVEAAQKFDTGAILEARISISIANLNLDAANRWQESNFVDKLSNEPPELTTVPEHLLEAMDCMLFLPPDTTLALECIETFAEEIGNIVPPIIANL